jgi:hypothetical protein
MRRRSGLGICVVAVVAAFGMSAIAASTASAGTYYWCVAKEKGLYSAGCKTKVAKGGTAELEEVKTCRTQTHGEYTNETCTTKSAKAKKGSFEKVAGPTLTAAFGGSELTSPDIGHFPGHCKAGTVAGEITGPKTGTERITFTGCEGESLPCESAGPNSTPSGKAGVIITNLLDTKLIDHGEKGPGGGEPASGEAWLELVSGEHEPYVREWNCAGVEFFRQVGSLSGVFTAGSVNVLSTTGELQVERGEGEQELGTEALTSEGWLGPFPSNEQVEGGMSVVTTPAVEVRT